MKKLKKSVKIILISTISFLCVAAIVLGCVFGLRKHDDPPAQKYFTDAQKSLANEINTNATKMDYEIIDKVPYASNCSFEQLTGFGYNYFSYKSANNREDFCIYKITDEGSVSIKHLTSGDFPYVRPNYTDYKISAIKKDYVVIKTTYNTSSVSGISDVCYSLVYFGDFDNPVEIFSYSTKGTGVWVPNGLELKENYFAITCLKNMDATTASADLEVIYNTYATSFENKTENKVLSGQKYYYNNNDLFKQESFENMFYVYSNGLYKIVYLKNGRFETIEKVLETDEQTSKFLYTYEIDELSSTKFLISKTTFLQESEINDNSVIVDESSSGNVYAGYDYFVYDYANQVATEKTLTLDNGYAKVSIPAKDELLTSSYELCFQKIADNYLVEEFLNVYYDVNNNQTIKFSGEKNEQIVCAGDNSFVTNYRILKPDNKVDISKTYVFGGANYNLIKANSTDKYIIVSKVVENINRYGLLDLYGNVALSPEQSEFSNIFDIVGENCIVNNNGSYYKYNIKTKEALKIENYYYSSTISDNSLGVYVTGDENNYSISNFNNILEENIKSVSMVVGSDSFPMTIRGGFFTEIKFLDGTSKVLYFYSSNSDITDRKTTFASGNGQTALTAENYATAVEYSADKATQYNDIGQTYATYQGYWGITKEEDPLLYMGDNYSGKFNTITLYLHFYNDHTLTIKSTYTPEGTGSGDWTVSYEYTGDLISTDLFLDDDVHFRMEFKFDFYNFFGYGDVCIQSTENRTYEVLYHNVYRVHRNNTDLYDENANSVSAFGVDYCALSIPLEDKSGSVSGASAWINAGHVDYWLIANNVWINGVYYNNDAYDFIPKSWYNSTHTWSVSGITCTMGWAMDVGGSYTVYADEYLRTYLFAHYIENTYKVHYTTNITMDNYSYYETVKATARTSTYSAPTAPSGYTFGGWYISSCYSLPDGYSHKITHNYLGLSKAWTWTGSSYSYEATGGSIFGINLSWSDGDIVYIGIIWNPIVYTITLNNQYATSAGTTAVYEHYTQNVYKYNLHTAMSTSSNPITCPTRTGYTFEGYYTGTLGTGAQLISATGYRTSVFTNTYFTKNSTIYAKWRAHKYIVAYYNSYEVDPPDNTADPGPTDYFVVESGQVFSIPTTTRLFYTLIGFNVTNATSGQTHYYGYTSSNLAYTSTYAVFNSTRAVTTYFKDLNAGTPNDISGLTQEEMASSTYASIRVKITPAWQGNAYDVYYDANDGYFDDDYRMSYTTAKTAGQLLCTLGGRSFYKKYNGEAYYALAYRQGMDGAWYTGPLLISTNPQAVLFYTSYQPNLVEPYEGTFEHLGKTWYVGSGGQWMHGNLESADGLSYTKYYASSGEYTVDCAQIVLSWFIFDNQYSGENYSITGDIRIPKRLGYTLIGWNVDGMDTVTDHQFYNADTGEWEHVSAEEPYATSVTLTGNYTMFKNLHGNFGEIQFTARWKPNEYNISYDLTNGSHEAGAWLGNERHPEKAEYSDLPDDEANNVFPVDNVFESVINDDGTIKQSWPVGYYFDGWTISGAFPGWQYSPDGIVWYQCDTTGTTLGRSYKYFRNMHSEQGATVTFKAVWTPYTYKIVLKDIDVEPDNRYDVDVGYHYSSQNVNTEIIMTYDVGKWIGHPARVGYTFIGWEITGMADYVQHYWNDDCNCIHEWFTSENGVRVNPDNPNEKFLFHDDFHYYDLWFMNLHYVQDAVVTLTAHWRPNTYNITYHYSTDQDLEDNGYSLPDRDDVNYVYNYYSSKTQTVTFDDYFTTYFSGPDDTQTPVVTIPTGYYIAGWLVIGATHIYGWDYNAYTYSYIDYDEGVAIEQNQQYRLDIDFFENTYHNIEYSTGDSCYYYSINMYAWYERVPYKAVLHFPYDGQNNVNDMSNYDAYYEYTYYYGDTVVLPSSDPLGNIVITSWLCSPNLYDDGGLKDAFSTFTYGSTTYWTHAGVSIVWGISNNLAEDPNAPVFHLYAEYDEDFDGSLDLLNFTYASAGYYYLSYCDSFSGFRDIVIPSRFNDGTHGPLDVRYIDSGAFFELYDVQSVYIPNSITFIGPNAFYYCEYLSTVTFEEGSKCESINENAFNSCFDLRYINLPDSLTYINEGAFQSCSGFTEITFPKNLTYIGMNAFSNTSLIYVDLPASVTYLDGSAFNWCTQLSSIMVDVNNPTYYSYNNSYVIRRSDEKLITSIYINYSGRVTLPSFIKSIGPYAFSGGRAAMPELVIPEGVTSIDSYAFYYCSINLTNVILPETLTSIGHYAFAYCSKLAKIYIPASVSTIGTYAFAGCLALRSCIIPYHSSLTKIQSNTFYNSGLYDFLIPSKVTSIESSAFRSCSSLSSVFIPDSVTSISASSYSYAPFYGCSSGMTICKSSYCSTSGWGSYWRYRTSNTQHSTFDCEVPYYLYDYVYGLQYDFSLEGENNEYIVVTGYSGGTEATIPEHAYKISFYGYLDEYDVNTVHIPRNVSIIDDYCFDSDYSGYYGGFLETVTFDEFSNLKHIGYDAFAYQYGITHISLPNRLEYIDSCAFEYTGLEEITIPKSVTFIGSWAFEYCGSLYGVTFEEGINLKQISGGLFYGCPFQSITIPASVENIKNQAFGYCNNLDSITIPKTVVDIENSVFIDCEYLTEIIFESGSPVTVIPQMFAHNCYRLSSITLPSNLKVIDESAFGNCYALTTISIPSTVEVIGYCAFSYCKALGNVTLPSSLKTLDTYAFQYCISMTSVTIPASVTKIGTNPFRACSAIESMTVNSSNTTFASYGNTIYNKSTKALISGCKNSTISTSASNVTIIGDYAFAYISTLTSITIPSNITRIEGYAFRNTGLASITIPSSVVFMGDYAFAECSALVIASIEAQAKTIPAYCFGSCTSLSTVSLNQKVEEIEKYAFQKCNSLASIFIPKSVRYIGYAAFFDNPSLANVNFEMGTQLAVIDQQAFQKCTALTKFFIPGSVRTIIGTSYYYNSPFYQCSSSLKLYCDAPSRPSGWNSYFNYYGNGTTLSTNYYYSWHGYTYMNEYYYSGTVLTGTKNNVSNVTVPDGTTAIGDGAFNYNDTIESITFPSSLKHIGYYVFCECSSLQSVSFNSGLETIGDGAFEYSGLKQVTIPSTVKTIGVNAFYDNASMETLIIEGNPVCGSQAFAYCSKLKNFSSPNLTRIYTSMFYSSFTDGFNEMTLSSTITAIEDYAFASAHFYDIEDFNMPSVTTIGRYAFRGSSSISDLYMPKVVSIGDFAFENARITHIHLPSTLMKVGVGITKGGLVSNIDMPTASAAYTYANKALVEIQTKSIVAVGSGYSGNVASGIRYIEAYAMFGSDASQLILPEGFMGIGEYACSTSKIQTLSTPSTISVIGACAFEACTNLYEINFAEGLSKIDDFAFQGCINSSFVSVYIPASVTYIGKNPFAGCSYLEVIKVAESNGYYDSREGCSAIIETGSNKLISGCRYTHIPDSVTQIYYSAFKNISTLYTIYIPSSVTTIHANSYDMAPFYGCPTTLAIYYDAVGSSWGSYSTKVNSFSQASLCPSFTYDGFLDDAYYEESLYYSSGTGVVLSGQQTSGYENSYYSVSGIVKCISSYAFEYNTIYVSIYLPATVYRIYEYAFEFCENLEELYFPPHSVMESIYTGAFYGCSKLKSVSLEKSKYLNYIDEYAFYDCSSLTSIIFPESLTCINNSAFYNTNISSVYIPKNVSTIGNMVFNANVLTSITIDSANKYYDVRNSAIVQTKLDRLIFATKNTTTIPNTIKVIGNSAFYYNMFGNSYTTITIPDSVIYIETNAFYNCTYLRQINLGKNVAKIGYQAFAYCSGMTEFVIPSDSRLQFIDSRAFLSCSTLNKIWLPKSLTYISASSYSYSPFYYVKSSCVIYTERAGKHSGWGTYWNYYRSSSSYILSVYYSTSQEAVYD